LACSSVVFSRHAIERMFERQVETWEVLDAIENGETIESYPNDTPHPSMLILSHVQGKFVHVLVARDPDSEECIIVTAYVPDATQREPGYRKRRKGK
jgi:Domain of unknown function (DUF4258)